VTAAFSRKLRRDISGLSLIVRGTSLRGHYAASK
jgi:hypothetical protein